MKPTFFKMKFEQLAILSAAIVLGVLLFVPPIVGVADNGDFDRIMSTVGLAYLNPGEPFTERFFHYAHSQYSLNSPGMGGYISSEIPVVAAATLFNRLFYSRTVFDIRFLGAVYALLCVSGMYMIVRAFRTAPLWTRIALALALIVVFCDVGYTAYFHSLFGEPVSLVFLLLTVGSALLLAQSAQYASIRLLTIFFICAVFLTAAKVQTAPLGVILTLFAVRLRSLRDDRSWLGIWGWGTALLLIVSAGIYISAPKELKVINQYQTVFNGVLHGSHDPVRDLRSIGVDPGLSVLAGTNYFTPDTPISQTDPRLNEQFYNRISHAKVALFYLAHPQHFVENLSQVAENSMMIRPYYLGNYTKSAGFAKGAMSIKFDFWSEWKKKSIPHNLPFLLTFFTFCTLALLLYHKHADRTERKLVAETLLTVEVIAAVSFVIPLIGDGLTDIGKHLFLFNACFDILSIGIVCAAIHLLCAGVKYILAVRRRPLPT